MGNRTTGSTAKFGNIPLDIRSLNNLENNEHWIVGYLCSIPHLILLLRTQVGDFFFFSNEASLEELRGKETF